MVTCSARDDLAWLFGACESEMGIKSNFSSFLIASKVGLNLSRVDRDSGELVNGAQEQLEGEDAMIDAIDTRRARSRLAATAKNRRIMAAYQRLDVRHQRVIEAAFEARQYPPEVRRVFGELAGIAPFTAAAPERFTWAWLARAIARGDSRAATMKAEAEALFRAAIDAFDQARAALAPPRAA
jgi:hypothetical protein